MTDADNSAVDFLASIVRGILRKPRHVNVQPRPGPNGSTYLDIIVPDDQRGMLVGRQGRMFNALTHVMRTYGAIRGRRYQPCVLDRFTPTEKQRNDLQLSPSENV